MKRCSTVVALAMGVSVALAGISGALWAQEAVPATAPATTPTTVPAANPAAEAYREARDLFDLGKYDEARAAAERALKANPNMQDARLLMLRIQAELAKRPVKNGDKPVAGAAEKGNLLTMEDVYRIRMYEMADEDLKSVRGTIDRKELERFWDEVVLKDTRTTGTSRDDRNAFLGSGLAAQVGRIKALNATEYFEKVKVTSDPESLQTFRTRIQPFVLQNCATAACHGGADPNGFKIYGTAGRRPSDLETYTNFYMLSTYTKGGAKMIDRDNPDDSLLLQYGLPANSARTPHPGKVDMRPMYSGKDDKRFQDVVGWIRKLSWPKPNYGITYTPVTTTQPAKP